MTLVLPHRSCQVSFIRGLISLEERKHSYVTRGSPAVPLKCDSQILSTAFTQTPNTLLYLTLKPELTKRGIYSSLLSYKSVKQMFNVSSCFIIVQKFNQRLAKLSKVTFGAYSLSCSFYFVNHQSISNSNKR